MTKAIEAQVCPAKCRNDSPRLFHAYSGTADDQLVILLVIRDSLVA